VRCRQEDEIAPNQRHQGLLVHPQEAGTTGHHQADPFVAGKLKAPRGRECQPTIKAPLCPKQVHHFCENIHNGSIVTAQVAGTFDGSPIQLRFHFTINGDKIAALTIRG
jgi:hypothetical protein